MSYAADLARFCKAMKTYADVYDKVKPKKELVAKLQIELDKANNELASKTEELNKVKDNVRRLREETQLMQDKKIELEKNMELTIARLERAQKLITLTADEALRWKESVKLLAV